jgi:hypothetical protein
MIQNNLKTQADIENNPNTNAIQQELLLNQERLKATGYAETPTDLYEQMLKQQEFKGKIQDNLNINGKEKRNLFYKKSK